MKLSRTLPKGRGRGSKDGAEDLRAICARQPATVRSSMSKAPPPCSICAGNGAMDRLQHLEGARALGRAVFVAATERERRTPGDVRTKQEIARAETRRRAVGVVHDLERTVLGTTGRCGVDSVVGTAEEAVLPQVTLAARECRRASARQPGVVLVLVDAVLKKAFGHAPATGTEALGMKMERDPRSSRDALDGVVIDVLSQPRSLQNGTDVIMRTGSHAKCALPNCINGQPLIRRQVFRTRTLACRGHHSIG
jgi:hypothetical protein